MTHTRNELVDLVLDTLERRLEALQVLKHQIFDIFHSSIVSNFADQADDAVLVSLHPTIRPA